MSFVIIVMACCCHIVRSFQQRAATILPKSIQSRKRQQQVVQQSSKLFTSLLIQEAAGDVDDDTSLSASSSSSFNPLGPPTHLQALEVGESYKIALLFDGQSLCITRVFRSPDIFLVPNLMSEHECLIEAAINKGLKPAGTRNSEQNTIRKNSYITWLTNNPNENDGSNSPSSSSSYDDDGNNSNNNNNNNYLETVRKTTQLCKHLFVHEALQYSKNDEQDYVTSEDMQIAKYDPGGCFNLHHDGYNRFLTCLTYLNGVGGTFFPLAQTGQRTSSMDDDSSPPPKLQIDVDGRLSSDDYVIGRDGLLVVGKEGEASYLRDTATTATSEANTGVDNPAIVRIQAGDSIVFYNYSLLQDNPNSSSDVGDKSSHQNNKEWRSLHAGLPVPENVNEKFIATNWFRSDALTGPFAHFHKDSLMHNEELLA